MASSVNLTLAGRRAVVTGAGRGIGRSIALALAQAGADVAASARTNTEIEALAAQIQSMGRQSLAVPCDVTNTEQVQHMAKILITGLYGRIINIASIAGRIGGSYIAAYTAAKHGVLGLTRALAVELMQYNITVNAICPGYVNTPMTDAQVSNIAARTGMSEAQAREVLEKASPQRRLMEPEEVASIAIFLAQDLSQGITGQAINIDGGGVMS